MAPLVLDKIVPDYGLPGTEITIKGNNFSTNPDENKVTFGDIEVPVISATSIELKVIAPEHKPGDVPVVITTRGQSVKGDFYFLRSTASEEGITYPQTDVGKVLKSSACPKIYNVMWDTTYNVTTGLDYYQMHITTDAGEKQHIYLLKTDPSKGVDIKVVLPSTTTSSTWKKQTLTVMAGNMDSSSKPLYAMINGDFWQMTSPINPRGPVHCGGTIKSSKWDYDPKVSQQALSYVAVTKEGKMTIAPRDNYNSVMNTLQECTGAGIVMVLNGQIQDVATLTMRDPRTAIGHTLDNIVWMLTVDGRHGTLGMTYYEMASIFHGLGCVAAANLDGGGSAQMLVKNPKTGKKVICNHPSDPTNGAGGQERAVINGWAIVKR